MILTTAAMCMALNVYWESRGESIPGQYAVAQVTMNRAHTKDKVCEVVMAKKQFSWTEKMVVRKSGKYVLSAKAIPKDEYAWWKAQRIAAMVLEGRKGIPLAEGTTHYHTTAVKPYWAKNYRMKAIIGRHAFYQLA